MAEQRAITEKVDWPIVGSKVQSLDTVTGNWYEASVLRTDQTPVIRIRFSGFCRKMSDCSVDIDNIRPCEEERLLARNTVVSRLEASRLLAEDHILYTNINEKEESAIVSQNDPFRGSLLTKDGIAVQYEDLLPIPAADAIEVKKKRKTTNSPEETVVQVHVKEKIEKKKKRRSEADPPAPPAKKKAPKKKAKAEMLASGIPESSVKPSDIDQTTTTLLSTPIKVGLNATELATVKQKVENWKTTNIQSSILADLNELRAKVNAISGTLLILSSNVSNIYALVKENKEKHVTPLKPTYVAPLIGSHVTPPKPSYVTPHKQSHATLGQIPTSTPTNYSRTPSKYATNFTSGLDLSIPEVYRQSSYIIESSYPKTTYDFNSTTSSIFGSNETNTSIFGSNESISDFTLTDLQTLHVPVPDRTTTDSFLPPPPTMPTLDHLVSQYQETCASLSIPDDSNYMYIDSGKLEAMFKKSQNSRNSFLCQLTTELFHLKEIIGKNVMGLQKKQRLDGNKVQFIKRQVFNWFPCSASVMESEWRNCIKAIDGKNRQRVHSAKKLNII